MHSLPPIYTFRPRRRVVPFRSPFLIRSVRGAFVMALYAAFISLTVIGIMSLYFHRVGWL